jgi:hypothetical protein
MSKSATPNTATPPPGRDARGRFAPGNPGGPGNPFARQSARLRQVLLEVFDEQEMRQVAFTLRLLAQSGNLTAIKLVLQYLIGKPGAAVDPDRLEVEEWKLAQESRVGGAAFGETLRDVPAETANRMLQSAWPAATEEQLRPLDRMLEALEEGEAAPEPAAPAGPAAEANGDNGAPHPRPLSQEGGGEGGAGDGRHAKPQAAQQPAPRPHGGRGENGAGGERPAGGGRPPRPPAGRPRHRAEANGGNGAGGPMSDARRRGPNGPGQRGASGTPRPGGG